MDYRRIVLVLRLAAAGLVLVGLVALTAPVPALGLDCGSPLSPERPTAADAWNDVYRVNDQIADCPRHLRARRVVGAAALLGGLAAAGLPLLVARRRRPDDEG